MAELSELKAMVNPPKPVMAVVEALGIVLLGQRMPWAAGGKHMLMDKSGVVARLMNCTPESVPADRVAKLRAMIRNTPELDLEAVAACSKAAAGIGEWLHAMAEAAPHPLHAARRVPRTVGPIF